jgi:stearoyl-CoA desaturase (Delta-9 desaturase)
MTELIAVLVMTHMTILCVTIFLHRSQAHRSVELHPAVAHVMRFWLWLTTGMVTREWVAVHRQHHQKCEQPGDPHSPHVYGIWRVLFGGAFLYHSATKDHAMIQRLGSGTPTDWMERNVYSRYSRAGILLLLLVELAVFGGSGAVMWLIQMAWIPFWAAGVVNGLGHWWGYRNGATRDRSTNLVPWGIVIGGEELHNNHHLDAANPKLSRKWWEFDIGWFWIKVLTWLKLARIRTSP